MNVEALNRRFLYECFLVCFKLITDIQNSLTPDKANIMLISKTLSSECTEKEKWFETHYCVQGLYQTYTVFEKSDIHCRNETHALHVTLWFNIGLRTF